MKRWCVTHNGHEIEVQNRWSGERLLIDGQLQDDRPGAFKMNSNLTGHIEHPDGTTETVKVSVGAVLVIVKCTIFVNDRLVFSG